jgi:hypothetical protein
MENEKVLVFKKDALVKFDIGSFMFAKIRESVAYYINKLTDEETKLFTDCIKNKRFTKDWMEPLYVFYQILVQLEDEAVKQKCVQEVNGEEYFNKEIAPLFEKLSSSIEGSQLTDQSQEQPE